jgi:hypothetical protein
MCLCYGHRGRDPSGRGTDPWPIGLHSIEEKKKKDEERRRREEEGKKKEEDEVEQRRLLEQQQQEAQGQFKEQLEQCQQQKL